MKHLIRLGKIIQRSPGRRLSLPEVSNYRDPTADENTATRRDIGALPKPLPTSLART